MCVQSAVVGDKLQTETTFGRDQYQNGMMATLSVRPKRCARNLHNERLPCVCVCVLSPSRARAHVPRYCCMIYAELSLSFSIFPLPRRPQKSTLELTNGSIPDMTTSISMHRASREEFQPETFAKDQVGSSPP